MLKSFSMLVVAGVLTIAGVSSASAATGGCAPAAPATARAAAPSTPASAGRAGTQTIRRYSAAPGTYRAPARSYRSNASGGLPWTATRKILGY